MIGRSNPFIGPYIRQEPHFREETMSRYRSLAVLILLSLAGDYALATTQIHRPETMSDDHAEETDVQLSCGAARDLLIRQGYDGISVRSCFTFAYTFTAGREGQQRKVFVDPQNGRIWEG